LNFRLRSMWLRPASRSNAASAVNVASCSKLKLKQTSIKL
jgi:hypothetical protein